MDHAPVEAAGRAALRFVAISGSLRAASSNTSVLQAAAMLAPAHIHVALYAGLGELPHFNPDLDTNTPPPQVAALRSLLQSADAILICSPEYAHGVPGALKNALDWIVSSGELMAKPLCLLNSSFASTHAQASLSETLGVMMARVTTTRVPLTTNRLGADDIAARPELADALCHALSVLEDAVLENAILKRQD